MLVTDVAEDPEARPGQRRREALFSQLRGSYRGAVWGIPSEAKDELTWCVSTGDVPPELSESYGDWVLLLFAQKIAEFAPSPRLIQGIKCQDLQRALQLTGADVIIVSLPDDIEWLIAERTLD